MKFSFKIVKICYCIICLVAAVTTILSTDNPITMFFVISILILFVVVFYIGRWVQSNEITPEVKEPDAPLGEVIEPKEIETKRNLVNRESPNKKSSEIEVFDLKEFIMSYVKVGSGLWLRIYNQGLTLEYDCSYREEYEGVDDKGHKWSRRATSDEETPAYVTRLEYELSIRIETKTEIPKRSGLINISAEFAKSEGEYIGRWKIHDIGASGNLGDEEDIDAWDIFYRDDFIEINDFARIKTMVDLICASMRRRSEAQRYRS